ncbi:MAG: cyclase family protein [Propionibacteriaceae bacterium]|jgi:hypothetical protein|nr:cyclase family protein [Propionibacteriaceae bacterium]
MPDKAESVSPIALPSFKELERVDGMPLAWGIFGDQDSVGLFNLVTPQKSLAAKDLIRKGAVFPLDVPFGSISPPFFQRGTPRHTVYSNFPGEAFEDVYDNYNPQALSQWDSLGHIAVWPERFYNDVASRQIAGGERNTIRSWSDHGIVTRGVLLDVSEAVRDRGGPSARAALSVNDLEQARIRAGATIEVGDVLMFYTGFLEWHAGLPAGERRRLSQFDSLVSPGIEQSEEMAEYLWDLHIAGIATDAVAVEAFPPDRSEEARPYGFMHRVLIGSFGLALGEAWYLQDLMEDCRADGVSEFMLVSVPFRAPGVSSPANAIAVK